MTDWKPIETAPKNGTIVLFRQGKMIRSGFMLFNKQYGKYYPVEVSRPDGRYCSTRHSGIAPTHWRPFPHD